VAVVALLLLDLGTPLAGHEDDCQGVRLASMVFVVEKQCFGYLVVSRNNSLSAAWQLHFALADLLE
jgi:hypothetical protein